MPLIYIEWHSSRTANSQGAAMNRCIIAVLLLLTAVHCRASRDFHVVAEAMRTRVTYIGADGKKKFFNMINFQSASPADLERLKSDLLTTQKANSSDAAVMRAWTVATLAQLDGMIQYLNDEDKWATKDSIREATLEKSAEVMKNRQSRLKEIQVIESLKIALIKQEAALKSRPAQKK